MEKRCQAVPYTVTAPFPGFPTDLQSALVAALSVSDGISVVEEKIFEARFQIVQELCRMKASVANEGSFVLVDGVEVLRGELGAEGVLMLIIKAELAQIPIAAVVIVKDTDPAGIGVVAGGDQVFFAAALEIGGGFPRFGRQETVVMDRIFLRNGGVVVG